MATYDQIRSKIYLLTKTNVTSLSNANLNLYTQPAEDRVASLIMHSDIRWQVDDSNYLDLPSAITTITSGQQDYSLATSHLTIDRVEIKDSGGNWSLLTPIDQHDIRGQALAQGETTRTGAYLSSNGTPLEYDKKGASVYLYPTPNYTQAASLKVYFSRGPLKFDYSTGAFTDATGSVSSSPGFNSLFHNLIALWASFEYAIANGLKNANQIFAEITRMETDLDAFYGLRSRDERPRMMVSTNGSMGSMSGRIGMGGSDSNR